MINVLYSFSTDTIARGTVTLTVCYSGDYSIRIDSLLYDWGVVLPDRYILTCYLQSVCATIPITWYYWWYRYLFVYDSFCPVFVYSLSMMIIVRTIFDAICSIFYISLAVHITFDMTLHCYSRIPAVTHSHTSTHLFFSIPFYLPVTYDDISTYWWYIWLAWWLFILIPDTTFSLTWYSHIQYWWRVFSVTDKYCSRWPVWWWLLVTVIFSCRRPTDIWCPCWRWYAYAFYGDWFDSPVWPEAVTQNTIVILQPAIR